MNLRRMLIALLLAIVVGVPPAIAAKRMNVARVQCDSAQALLESAQRDGQEIITLRARQQQVAVSKRPQEHVLAQVNAVLAEAGIPSRKLQGIRPEADQALPGSPSAGSGSSSGPQYRRQSVSIAFQQMEMAELGQFLAAWRSAELLWMPIRLELTKHRSRGGEDDFYDTTLVISTVYIADA